MENFQEMITQAAELKEFELKKDRKQFESLPSFLKTGLNHSKKYEQLRRQHFSFQMFVSDSLKNQGNSLVAQQSYQEATAKYEQALAVFRWIDAATNQNIKDSDLSYGTYKPEGDHAEMLNSHLSKLYLNLSLCLTKLNRKADAVSAADQCLSIEPDNAKAYYRKGQAYVQYINRQDSDIKQGLKWLERSYEISKDQQVWNEILSIRRKVVEQRQKAKKTFSFIMNSGNKTENTEPTNSSKTQECKQTAAIEHTKVEAKATSAVDVGKKEAAPPSKLLEMIQDPVGLKHDAEEVQPKAAFIRKSKRTGGGAFQASSGIAKKLETNPPAEAPVQQEQKKETPPQPKVEKIIERPAEPKTSTNPIKVVPVEPVVQKQFPAVSKKQVVQDLKKPSLAEQTKQSHAEREHMTEERLRKLLDHPHWELELLEQFILKNGRKISAIMEMFNYGEYTKEHDELLKKCLLLHRKFSAGFIEVKENGETHKLDLSNKEVAQAVAQQKMSLYGQYMKWLQSHPIDQFKKYVGRYESHRKFLLTEIQRRDYIVIDRRQGLPAAKPKNGSQLLPYIILAMVVGWLTMNLYRWWRQP